MPDENDLAMLIGPPVAAKNASSFSAFLRGSTLE
jgi:hypothetical protein